VDLSPVGANLPGIAWHALSTGSPILGGGGGVVLSDDTPDGLGTATAGVSDEASRSDHIHPMPDATDVGADPAGSAQAVADTLGTAAAADVGDFATAAQGTDARTPTAHASSHQDGGSDELALDGSQITTGTVAAARLGTGTPSSANFLRGDGSWQTVSGGDVTHVASVGAQTAGDGTALSTGNGHQLLDTAISLPAAAAGDSYTFVGFVSLLNNSGGSRNYRPGITLGSTFTQMTANFSMAANASTFIMRIEGHVNVVSTSVQQFGFQALHPNSGSSFGIAASSATEDFASAKNLQLHFFCSVSTSTQSVQLLSLQVSKVTA
jgi:hypothetical protein